MCFYGLKDLGAGIRVRIFRAFGLSASSSVCGRQGRLVRVFHNFRER